MASTPLPGSWAVLDSYLSSAVLLDLQGRILYANPAWLQFMESNGGMAAHCGVGVNYLGVCESASPSDEIASVVARGLRSILSGESDWFEAEYPCHAPNEKRWFRMRAESFSDDSQARILVLHSPVAPSFLRNERPSPVSSRLESLLDALPVPSVIVAEKDYEVLYANPAFFELSGYLATDVFGVGLRTLIAGNPELSLGRAARDISLRRAQWMPPVDVRLTADRLDFRSIDAWLVCCVDVTDLKQHTVTH